MPNIAIANTVKRHYFEVIICFLLLLLIVPIKIKIEDEEEKQFQKYLETFNRSYDNSLYRQRFEAFRKSLEAIKLLNANQTNKTAEYGLTKFSDMLPEEFLHSALLPDLSIYLRSIIPLSNIDDQKKTEEEIVRIKQAVSKYNIPVRLDWREKNMVTKIINQDLCSACWAFSSIGMIESLNGIKTGKLEKLSIQQVIDCAKYSDGCNGGNICSLLRWLKTSKIKLVNEDEYPLVLKNQQCKNITSGAVQIKDYQCTSLIGSEDVILALVAKNGPVAVAVNALTWQNYVGGVIQFHCDNSALKLNHAVEIVGYDLTGDVPYYIARNSWGKDFGDNGYLYLAIGKNTCGLANEVYVVSLL